MGTRGYFSGVKAVGA